MGKIENEHQLEITREWVRRFKQIYEKQKEDPITVPDALDSTRFLIEKLEREIEEYFAEEVSEKTSIQKITPPTSPVTMETSLD